MTVVDLILIRNILIFIVIILLVITIKNWKVLKTKDEDFLSLKRIKKLFILLLTLFVLIIILIINFSLVSL